MLHNDKQSKAFCVSTAVFPSKKQNYISTGSSMTAKKPTTDLQGCYIWLIKLQLSFLLLTPNMNTAWLQIVYVPQHYLCNNIRPRTSLFNVINIIIQIQQRTYYSSIIYWLILSITLWTYSTDWLDNSKKQIGTNWKEAYQLNLRCYLGIWLKGLEKIFSLRIFNAPAKIQTGHNTNQSITASDHLLSGKNKIFMGVRWSDYVTKK